MITIEKVELENITSFDEASVEFREGINVLLGVNGAGKSSIISMLGFVLFGSLPRKQNTYIRIGGKKKSGTASVVFMGKDEQRYRISRKITSSRGYSAPEIYQLKLGKERKLKDYNKKEDVEDFVKDHLGLEKDAKLSTIFENAVGVEQGKLTYAFDLARGARRDAFREILDLNKYRMLNKEYLNVDKEFSKLIIKIDKNIAEINVKLGDLDEQHQELVQFKKDVKEKVSQISTHTKQITALEGKKEDLLEKKKKVDEISAEVSKVESVQAEKKKALDRLKGQILEAQESAKICEKSHKGYKTYLKLEQKEQTLRKKEADFDRIEAQLKKSREGIAQTEGQIKSLQKDIHSIEEQKDEYEKAKKAVKKHEDLDEKIKRLDALKIGLEGDIKTNVENKSLSKDGKCPFLKEQCKNIGGGSLEEYFQEIIDNKKEQLKNRESEISKLKNQQEVINDLVSRHPKLEVMFADTLPSHTKKLTKLNTHITVLKKELEPLTQKEGEIAKARAQLQKVGDQKQSHKSDHDLYMAHKKTADSLETLQGDVTLIEGELEKIAKDVFELTARKHKFEKKFDKDEFDRVESKLTKSQNLLGSLQGEVKTIKTQIKKTTKKIKMLEKEKDVFEQKQKELESTQELQAFGNQIRGWFDKIEPKITAVMIESINSKANEIFHDLMDDQSVDIRWDQDFSIIVETPTEKKDFGILSGGEKMAAALAIRLGLLKYLSQDRITFTIFDEPTINLDESKRGNLARSIRRLQGFSQLFVISHDDTFESIADHVIRLSRKSDEPTKIEYR